MGDVVLHLPEAFLGDWRRRRHLELYPRLADAVSARGGRVRVEARTAAMMDGSARPGDGDLHIVENGACHGPGWLNAALAYLPGFWHLDPEGVLADSSARRDTAPAFGADDAATAFADGLRGRFADRRQSRYRQARERSIVPAGCIAVFLQGPIPYRRGQAFLPAAAMLRAVARGAGGRAVVAKPHPRMPDFGLKAILAAQADGCEILASDANVHDILSAACATVSVNSATAIEGFLHGRPAILFGRADFAALAETCRTAGEFPTALAQALARPRAHDAGLHWYFTRHCLQIDAADFEARLFAILAAGGYSPDRLAPAAPAGPGQ